VSTNVCAYLQLIVDYSYRRSNVPIYINTAQYHILTAVDSPFNAVFERVKSVLKKKNFDHHYYSLHIIMFCSHLDVKTVRAQSFGRKTQNRYIIYNYYTIIL